MSTSPRLTAALMHAQDAFWAKIAECYPEAKSGDFPPDATSIFDDQCEAAVKYWIKLNCPLADTHPVALVGTGGGCEAWEYRDAREHPGFFVWITELDDAAVPDDPETADLVLCTYSDRDDDCGSWFAEQIIRGGRAGLNAFYLTAVGYEPDKDAGRPLPFFDLLGLVAGVVLRQGAANHRAGRRHG